MIASKFFRWAAAAVTLGGAVSSAWAQAQSPANAHAFLQTVAASQPLSITDLSAHEPKPARVATVESAQCVSRVTVERAGQPQAVHAIQWREVRRIDREDSHTLRLSAGPLAWQLRFETDEMASRMNNALTVLRRSCDPTQGFGF